ncbi:alpha/beta hydrolase [Microbispora sp. RL4-1S]|uniref:Alpha/beta hydrolase n=1 Tax=Microbispora oryzae TaxID=2806554 RepID=A0A940WE41_9ACTN|nr:alpha/beta hydrolase [Microbispora oryzae]MBP2702938.1 alpha/beta hydrolase [Microbispora oryzae]
MAEPMIVLVHSPLVGPKTWWPVAERLRARGRSVVVPSLVDTVSSPPPRYLALADTVCSAAEGGPADAMTLVVHSGAGGLVPSIVDRTALPVDAVVFVDATLPYSGQSWMDTAPAELVESLRRSAGPDGFLPPWHEWFPPEAISELLPDPRIRAELCAEIPRVPWAYLEEIAPEVAGWQDRPCGYVRLSDGYDDVTAEAGRRRWPVVRHDGHHLSAVTGPEAVTHAILTLLDRL